jgi:hypothetical protein
VRSPTGKGEKETVLHRVELAHDGPDEPVESNPGGGLQTRYFGPPVCTGTSCI